MFHPELIMYSFIYYLVSFFQRRYWWCRYGRSRKLYR